MGELNATQILLLGLISAVVVVAGLARRFSVSYPIVLVIAGLMLSLVPHLPRVRLPPELVFLVFLPPLLFSAAWYTSWREFKAQLVSISLLAFGLVFFTAFGVAVTAHHFMPGFDWRLGFLLGAIVSPTDALAATSIARRVGMPQRIVDILEGESLLNDATGLLALQFGVQMITEGTTPQVGHSVLEFFWLVGGGIGIGLLCAVAAAWAERFVDDGPVEIIASFLIAYGSYLTGEAVHSSGVMSTVVCGLYLSRKSSNFFSPLVRLQANSVWEAVEFLLNGLVFVLIGLQLPYVLAGIQGYGAVRLALYGLGFSATLIALRMLWSYPGARLGYEVRTRVLHHQDVAKPTAKSVFVIGWTGMRGVVALAAAGSLPFTLPDGSAFPQRDMIIFLTYSVILVTLLLQGLTLPALVRLLKLDAGEGTVCEETEARRILLQSAITYLEGEREGVGEVDGHAYDDLLHVYRHKLQSVNECGSAVGVSGQEGARNAHMVMLQTVQREREELIALRNSGRIGDAVRRTLERELDLSESRLALQADGSR